MLRACRQAVLSANSLSYVTGCACQLPVTGRILCRSTLVDDDRHGYYRCFGNARRYCSRYIQGLIPHRLQSAPPWRTIFFGTDEYALVHLKALNENRVVGDRKLVSQLEVVVPTSQVNEREGIVIASWAARVQYNAFCHALGTGMSIHLQENDLLRDVFGLGPPMLGTNAVSNKASKTERHMAHDAAFKARTKCRAKMRDKKSVGAGLD